MIETNASLLEEIVVEPPPPADPREGGPDDLMIGHDPEKVKSRYLLLVHRAQPYGFGFTVFCIDRFEPLYIERGEEDRAVLAYQAYNEDGELITQFPATFQYLLLHRSAYKPLYNQSEPPVVEKVKTGHYL